MSERTLLDIMDQIDDSFIEEAANPEILLSMQRKKHRVRLVRRVSSIAACLLIAVGVVSAIPYLRVMERDEEIEINAAMDAALSSHAVSNQSSEIGASEADRIAAEESLKKDYAAASKAAQEAADKAAAAEKAAMEAAAAASKQAVEASKKAEEAAAAASKVASSVAAALVSTSSADHVGEDVGAPIADRIRVGEITYAYSDHVLYALTVDANTRLEELVLPAELNGVKFTELARDFWYFADANPNLRCITVPESITEFGDISCLSRSVEIICAQGSAAEIFFTANGYTVKNP